MDIKTAITLVLVEAYGYSVNFVKSASSTVLTSIMLDFFCFDNANSEVREHSDILLVYLLTHYAAWEWEMGMSIWGIPWEWEYVTILGTRKMGTDCSGMGRIGNVKNHSRSPLLLTLMTLKRSNEGHDDFRRS